MMGGNFQCRSETGVFLVDRTVRVGGGGRAVRVHAMKVYGGGGGGFLTFFFLHLGAVGGGGNRPTP